MEADLIATLAALADDDREGIVAALDAQPSFNMHQLASHAMSLIADRPLVAFRVYEWLGRQAEPEGARMREEWLRAHNNACHLAGVVHAEPQERRAIVQRALVVAPDNIAIYHNAACVLCLLGDADMALEVIREGIARGYDDATIQSIAEDTDLDLIRDTDAFRDVIAGRGELTLPSWAAGWTAWEYVQFRELVRTTLPSPDLSDFDEGTARSAGRELDVRPLAAECSDRPHDEWGGLVIRRLT